LVDNCAPSLTPTLLHVFERCRSLAASLIEPRDGANKGTIDLLRLWHLKPWPSALACPDELLPSDRNQTLACRTGPSSLRRAPLIWGVVIALVAIDVAWPREGLGIRGRSQWHPQPPRSPGHPTPSGTVLPSIQCCCWRLKLSRIVTRLVPSPVSTDHPDHYGGNQSCIAVDDWGLCTRRERRPLLYWFARPFLSHINCTSRFHLASLFGEKTPSAGAPTSRSYNRL